MHHTVNGYVPFSITTTRLVPIDTTTLRSSQPTQHEVDDPTTRPRRLSQTKSRRPNNEPVRKRQAYGVTGAILARYHRPSSQSERYDDVPAKITTTRPSTTTTKPRRRMRKTQCKSWRCTDQLRNTTTTNNDPQHTIHRATRHPKHRSGTQQQTSSDDHIHDGPRSPRSDDRIHELIQERSELRNRRWDTVMIIETWRKQTKNGGRRDKSTHFRSTR